MSVYDAAVLLDHGLFRMWYMCVKMWYAGVMWWNPTIYPSLGQALAIGHAPQDVVGEH